MYKSIVQSCDTYYYVLANDMGIDRSPLHAPVGFGSVRTGIDIGEAWIRRAALARMEEAPLQAPRAAEVVRRRDHLGRHRPGLQRLHAMLQLAHAAAGRWRNNGVLYRPHIPATWSMRQDRRARMIEPQPMRTIPIKPVP